MKSRFTNNFAFTIKAVFLLIDNNFCKSKSKLTYSDFHLHKCLLTRFLLFSNQIYLQVVPLLINFGQKMVNQGNEEYDKENYLIFDFLRKNKLLYVDGIFSVVRLFNFIRLELRYGTIEKAEQLLEESLKVITPAQKDSFQYLIDSRISFAKKDYKISLRKISTINPSDSIYYFPLHT